MRSLSFRTTTFLSSSIITIIFIFFIVLLQALGYCAPTLAEGFIFSAAIFLTSYTSLYIILSKFVFKGINNIKSTVIKLRKLNDSKTNIYSEAPITGNEVEDLSNEVLVWAEERKNEIDKLKKLEQYRREFLGNVSHELKTPVFNIQGYVVTLLDGGLEDPSINRDYLMRAEKSVDRMIGMIGDLEAITQLETGQLELDIERFDIVNVVKDVFDAEEMKATNKGIILRFRETYDKPLFVYADKFRIRQVITNLIVNSIHYGKEYGETVVRFYNTGDDIVVEVADNGPGIAEEHLPRLFERFYRVDKGRSRAQGGTGLGLSIVKHIIEAHGQAISVKSKVGSGTTFSFNLKRAKD